MKEQHNFLIQESSEMYGFKIGIFFTIGTNLYDPLVYFLKQVL